MTVDTGFLGRALGAHLADAARPILFHDRATGLTHALPFAAAGDPAGLLPVFVVAGEAVWREATGKSFALDIRPDPDALFGRSLRAVGSGTFSILMLAMMEAASRAAGRETLLVNDLRVQWASSLDRAEPRPPAASWGLGVAP
jgi:hypothetical protein